METMSLNCVSGGASLDFERGNTSWSGLIEVLRCDPPGVIFVDDDDGSLKYRYETLPVKQQELADGRLDAEEFREWLADNELLDEEGNAQDINTIPGWWTPAPDAPLRESETISVGDADGYLFYSSGDDKEVGEGRYVLRMSVTEDQYDPDHHNHDTETYDENRFGYASADDAHAAAVAWAREWHKEKVEWAEDQDYQIEMEEG